MIAHHTRHHSSERVSLMCCFPKDIVRQLSYRASVGQVRAGPLSTSGSLVKSFSSSLMKTCAARLLHVHGFSRFSMF